jgi:hypothetical protein
MVLAEILASGVTAIPLEEFSVIMSLLMKERLWIKTTFLFVS